MKSILNATIDKYLENYVEVITKQIPTNDRLAYELAEIACKAFLPAYNRARGSKQKRFEKGMDAADRAVQKVIEELLRTWASRAKSLDIVGPVIVKARQAEKSSVMALLANSGEIKYAKPRRNAR